METLRLKALHLCDFGPFKGPQTIDFPSGDGVVVIYGENMRGKTSLLNAIRFAFFGKVLGRGSKQLALHKIGNLEQRQVGKFGFEVALKFLHERREYKLTRTCRARAGVTPASDDDYVVDSFLERDGVVLGPHQADIQLRSILPEQVSRFFLFDGELLQEYEDLLSSESDQGRQISQAIERILGVPVLTSTRTTLLQLKEKAEHREATAAQGDQKTREFGNQLADLHAQRHVLTEETARLERDLQDARSEKAAVEELMKKKERYTALLEKKDTLEKMMKTAAQRRDTKAMELQQAMSSAWCTVLHDRMQREASGLERREAVLQSELMRMDVLRSLHAGDAATCPACLQPVSAEARAKIEASLHGGGGAARDEKHQEVNAVRRRLAALKQHITASQRDVLRMLWNDVEDAEVDHASKKDELAEITSKQLEGVDEDELRKVKLDFEASIREIDILERGIGTSRTALEENKTHAEAIQKRLDKLSGTNLSEQRKRRELYASLHKLFDDSVGVYREQLRKKVEADATRHFRALTTEPDYESLRINESYGLTIVHRDGNDIPVRSAGGEHVVAISLVGALQNNAPLSGPIVIDSPFGRLDRGHTERVIRTLPTMTKQVVLLVHDVELPPDLARKELKSNLRAEWKLERRSARHTDIVKRKD